MFSVRTLHTQQSSMRPILSLQSIHPLQTSFSTSPSFFSALLQAAAALTAAFLTSLPRAEQSPLRVRPKHYSRGLFRPQRQQQLPACNVRLAPPPLLSYACCRARVLPIQRHGSDAELNYRRAAERGGPKSGTDGQAARAPVQPRSCSCNPDQSPNRARWGNELFMVPEGPGWWIAERRPP
jgi:hypothetical protein